MKLPETKKIRSLSSSILKKVAKVKLPKKSTSTSKVIKNVKPVSSSQISEKIKDFFSQIPPKTKKCLEYCKKLDLQKYSKIALLVVVCIYLIGGIVLSIFAYKAGSKKTDMKLTKRDIWVKKISIVYPLPAATVNGKFISLSQFYKQVSYLKNFNNQVSDSLSKEISDEITLRKRVLSNIIDSNMVRQEAEKNNIKVTKKDIEDAYKTAADANGGTDQIEQVLSKLYGMNKDQFMDLIEEQLYREKVQEKLLTQYHIKHILLTDQPKADAAKARLDKGESFDAVASSASEDSNSKAQGGDLGWLSRGDLKDKIDPEFEKTIVAMKKGQVSGIIKTKYGYHIVKLEDKKGKIDMTIEDWITSIEKKAKIHRFIKS